MGTTLLAAGMIGTNYYSMMRPTVHEYAVEHGQTYYQRLNNLQLSLASGLLSFVLGVNLLVTNNPNQAKRNQNESRHKSK